MEKSSSEKDLDCQEFTKLIQLIVDDEATDEQKLLFKSHEGKCGHCAEIYNIEQSVIDLVRQKITKECCPQGFAAKVREMAIQTDQDA